MPGESWRAAAPFETWNGEARDAAGTELVSSHAPSYDGLMAP